MKHLLAPVALPLLASAYIPSTPDLGKAEGRCRADEAGPAFIVTVVGLKDRKGQLKLEVYPNSDGDFLKDDNLLVASGKVFRRVEQPVPAAGPVELCIRVPAPGPYSLSLLHDRDMNRRFGWTSDGIGFSANPHIGWGKPKAAATRAVAGGGLTRLTIVMNYRHGLGVAPLKTQR